MAAAGSGVAPLGVRDYRLLFTGLVINASLMPLQFISSIFWVQKHADPAVMILLVGLIGTMRGVGSLLFGLYGGALADRFDRRSLLRGMQASLGVLSIATASVMATSEGGGAAMTLFFVLVFAASAIFAIDAPTRLAFVPDLLGPRLTPAGISLNTAGGQIAMPVAIFASGFLMDELGFATTYALTACGPLAEVICLSLIRHRAERAADVGPHPARGGLGRTLHDVRYGLRYVRSEHTVLWIIVMMITIALGFPAVANLGPTWITTVVGVSTRNIGLVMVTWGVGGLVASLVLTRYSLFERKGAAFVIAALGFASSFLLFSFGRTMLVPAIANFGLGLSMATSQITSVTLIQHLVPNEVRGRVMSLLQLNMGLAQVATFPIAALGQAIGLELLFPLLAGVVFTTTAAIALTQRRLWTARIRTSDLFTPEPADLRAAS